MYRLFLSLRFFRRRKINLLSVVCIALGVMVLIIVYSVLDGFQSQLKDAFRKTIPHVMVENLGTHHTYEDYAAVLSKVPGVTAVAPRVETLALLGWRNPGKKASTLGSNRVGQKGIYVIAIDPEQESRVTGFTAMLTGFPAESRHLQVEDPEHPFRISDALRGNRMPRPGIVLGEELAKALQIERGAEVTLISVRMEEGSGPDRTAIHSSNETFYLAGAFRSGMYEQNLFTVYIPLEAGEELLQRAGYAVKKIALGTDNFEEAETVKVACQNALSDPKDARDASGARLYFYGERLTTWQDRNRTLLNALVVEKRVLAVLMFLLVLMACGTILAILYMMVLEKRREIGILKALGAPMGGLLQLVLVNGGIIGLFGSLLGVGAGLLFLRYINNIESFLSRVVGLKVFPKEVYVFDSLPVVYNVQAITITAVATVLFSFLAASIPAYIAARSDPVRSLRNE